MSPRRVFEDNRQRFAIDNTLAQMQRDDVAELRQNDKLVMGMHATMVDANAKTIERSLQKHERDEVSFKAIESRATGMENESDSSTDGGEKMNDANNQELQ